MYGEVQEGEQEGAHRERLVEIRDGAEVVDDAFFDDRDEVEHRADSKSAEGYAEEMFASPHQRKDGVHETEGVQRGGHAQPDNAHFSHGAIR